MRLEAKALAKALLADDDVEDKEGLCALHLFQEPGAEWPLEERREDKMWRTVAVRNAFYDLDSVATIIDSGTLFYIFTSVTCAYICYIMFCESERYLGFHSFMSFRELGAGSAWPSAWPPVGHLWGSRTRPLEHPPWFRTPTTAAS